MNTILDYVYWRGDLTVKERPFNEVDNLILAEAVYFVFDGVYKKNITIEKAYKKYLALKEKPVYDINDPTRIVEACASAKRFKNVKICDYVSVTDDDRQIQFAAATFVFDKKNIFVAFRGTDGTITGWREDCNFAYMNETSAQHEAKLYLDSVLEKYPDGVTVGGHSKGGNLAVYASAFCKDELKERIKLVYSNDGPGFNDYVVSQKGYDLIIPKVRLILPESSVVGIILSNKAEKTVIKSNADKLIFQHDPFTWGVDVDKFLTVDERSSTSVMIEEIVSSWLRTLSNEDREKFVNSLFDSVENAGVHTLGDLATKRLTAYNAILSALRKLEKDAKNSIFKTVTKLIGAGKDVLWTEAKKKFERKSLPNEIKE